MRRPFGANWRNGITRERLRTEAFSSDYSRFPWTKNLLLSKTGQGYSALQKTFFGPAHGYKSERCDPQKETTFEQALRSDFLWDASMNQELSESPLRRDASRKKMMPIRKKICVPSAVKETINSSKMAIKMVTKTNSWWRDC